MGRRKFEYGESGFSTKRLKKRNDFYHNLLATFYFPTNSWALGGNDNKAMSALATWLSMKVMLGEEVRITLLGHSDHRGKADYNMWLAGQRVQSVARRLRRSTPNLPNLMLMDGWSWGELGSGLREDTESSKDRYDLAFERRVTVFWTEPKYFRFTKDLYEKVYLESDGFARAAKASSTRRLAA